eukprot:scaffold56640_cov21-Tisochrysis_lutea.AAC.4
MHASELHDCSACGARVLVYPNLANMDTSWCLLCTGSTVSHPPPITPLSWECTPACADEVTIFYCGVQVVRVSSGDVLLSVLAGMALLAAGLACSCAHRPGAGVALVAETNEVNMNDDDTKIDCIDNTQSHPGCPTPVKPASEEAWRALTRPQSASELWMCHAC